MSRIMKIIFIKLIFEIDCLCEYYIIVTLVNILYETYTDVS